MKDLIYLPEIIELFCQGHFQPRLAQQLLIRIVTLFCFTLFEVFTMSTKLQHYLNPLHIYCRLRDMGIAKGIALGLCRVYERIIFKPLLVKSHINIQG